MSSIANNIALASAIVLFGCIKAIEKIEFSELVESDISFAFDFDEDYACKLRTMHDLENKVRACLTELDKVITICNWVHHLWKHNGNSTPIASDPLSILQEVIEHKKEFRCVEYSIVLNGCLNALGVRCRTLSLKTADCQTREYGAGHLVNEAYVTDFDKWVMIDCQENCIPFMHTQPLNAVELQWAIANNYPIIFLSKNGSFSQEETSSYISFIRDYLYYFQAKITQRFIPAISNPTIMLVPLGAEKPTMFQLIYPLTDIQYTHSLPSFYQIPKASHV